MIRLSLLLCRGHWSANQQSHAATESRNCHGEPEVQNVRQNAYLSNEMVASWPTLPLLELWSRSGHGDDCWNRTAARKISTDCVWTERQSAVGNTASYSGDPRAAESKFGSRWETFFVAPASARTDRIKCLTHNRKDLLSVGEWLGLGLKGFICTIDK